MLIKLNKIKANPNNPRLVKDDKFKKLVNSIKELPEMLEIRPIVVNKDMIVLGGNMRLKACKEAGLKEVPVIIADLSEYQQRQFIIKDNVGFGEWDWDILANEWETELLNDWGLDTPDGFGIPLEAEEDDYEIPDDIETDIVLGDIIEIGEHRLMCGDSTCADTVHTLMNGQLADMVFTDPPYNIDYGNIKHPKFKQREIKNDDMSSDEFRDFCNAFISNIYIYNKGCVYITGPPGLMEE